MYLFFSQAKCVVLQTLGDYYNCEVTFQNDGNKIKNEIQGLIDNLQVMKCYRWMQFICICNRRWVTMFLYICRCTDAQMKKKRVIYQISRAPRKFNNSLCGTKLKRLCIRSLWRVYIQCNMCVLNSESHCEYPDIFYIYLSFNVCFLYERF